MNKDMKLYNVIFPIWLLLFFPPVIFVTLIGNYIFDSIVILACFYLYKLTNLELGIKTFYKGCILKTWLYGFLADLIGGIILFAIGICGDNYGLPYEITSAICYDPFSQPLAIVAIIFTILISGVLIYLFNYKIVFKELIKDKIVRYKIALTLAVITAPWTFLLPSKWFYYY